MGHAEHCGQVTSEGGHQAVGAVLNIPTPQQEDAMTVNRQDIPSLVSCKTSVILPNQTAAGTCMIGLGSNNVS